MEQRFQTFVSSVDGERHLHGLMTLQAMRSNGVASRVTIR
jgi:hypothetical protein